MTNEQKKRLLLDLIKIEEDGEIFNFTRAERAEFQKWIDGLIDQEPRWIPVEEKMPKDGQNVLFCDIDNDIMVGYHVRDRSNTHFSQDGSYEDMKNVRAWMPLPAPFEPQESEDKE